MLAIKNMRLEMMRKLGKSMHEGNLVQLVSVEISKDSPARVESTIASAGSAIKNSETDGFKS